MYVIATCLPNSVRTVIPSRNKDIGLPRSLIWLLLLSTLKTSKKHSSTSNSSCLKSLLHLRFAGLGVVAAENSPSNGRPLLETAELPATRVPKPAPCTGYLSWGTYFPRQCWILTNVWSWWERMGMIVRSEIQTHQDTLAPSKYPSNTRPKSYETSLRSCVPTTPSYPTNILQVSFIPHTALPSKYPPTLALTPTRGEALGGTTWSEEATAYWGSECAYYLYIYMVLAQKNDPPGKTAGIGGLHFSFYQTGDYLYGFSSKKCLTGKNHCAHFCCHLEGLLGTSF